MKKSYLKDGYFTIKGVFSKEHMNKVREDLDRIADEDYSDMIHPHKKSDEVKKLIFSKEINEIISELFDDDFEAVQSQLRYNKGDSDGFPLHQDDFWTRAGHGNTINVLVHVDDANEDNGCIFVYPESHNPPFFSDKDNLIAESGDVTFLHNFILHGSDKNNSGNFRRNLLLMYVKKGIKYRSGTSAKREVISDV